MRFRYLDIIFDNSSYSLHFKGCFFRAKHRFHFLRESDPLFTMGKSVWLIFTYLCYEQRRQVRHLPFHYFPHDKGTTV